MRWILATENFTATLLYSFIQNVRVRKYTFEMIDNLVKKIEIFFNLK